MSYVKLSGYMYNNITKYLKFFHSKLIWNTLMKVLKVKILKSEICKQHLTYANVLIKLKFYNTFYLNCFSFGGLYT